MDARTVLLTGGTSGLGRATAARLGAAGGGEVMATGRRPAGTPPPGVRWAALDLADRAAVRDLAAEVGPLRALVANAGSQFTSPVRTDAGWEATFAVNHLGHVELVCGLLRAGALAPGSRIVVVSSGTHDPRRLTGMPHPRLTTVGAALADLDREGAWAARRRYTTSKLANAMTALLLARRLAARGITVTAYDPGLMPGTGLTRTAAAPVRLLWGTLALGLRALPGVSSPARSARTLAALATGPEWEGVTGRYVAIDAVAEASAQARDVAAQERLWAESLAALGIADDPTA